MSIDVIKKQLIARHNDFVERQRLSELRRTIVPASDIDDRIARDRIRVVDFDWEQDTLTLTLSQPVNPEWVQAIQFGNYSHAAVWNKGPEVFHFQRKMASISAHEHEVQDVINHFKNWLGPAHQIYVERLQQARRSEEERQRRTIEKEIEDRERRRRVLSQIKI